MSAQARRFPDNWARWTPRFLLILVHRTEIPVILPCLEGNARIAHPRVTVLSKAGSLRRSMCCWWRVRHQVTCDNFLDYPNRLPGRGRLPQTLPLCATLPGLGDWITIATSFRYVRGALLVTTT